MNIAVIGAGNVGGTLGTRLARNGHRVIFASREPDSEKMREVVSGAGPNASAGSNADAAAQSHVILLTTPFETAQAALRSAGSLTGKIVIDATNPLLPTLEGLSVANTDSAGEQVARWCPGAHVVKAFNTVGYGIMADPVFQQGKVAMFNCGDDAAAKAQVAKLINELGFEALDAGPLRQARVLEPFAMLWISLAVQYGYGPRIAFELLRSSTV